MYGHLIVWDATCVDTLLYGMQHVWTPYCMGCNMCGHLIVWDATCVDTYAPSYSRVASQEAGDSG